MITPEEEAASVAKQAASQGAANAQRHERLAHALERPIDHFLSTDGRVVLAAESGVPEAVPLLVPSEILALLDARYRAAGCRTTLVDDVLTIESS